MDNLTYLCENKRNLMRIRRKFRKLTGKTYPKGTEYMLEDHLPAGWSKDPYGNYYLVVGESTTMFACHLDTVGTTQSTVTHVMEGDLIRTDGTTILGADDKAGMVVLLYMIQQGVPGVYYFFTGEESGCIGSGKVADAVRRGDHPFPELRSVTKVVSFDRRGTTSVITEQMFTECCSEEFASTLSTMLNSTGNNLDMRPDNTGVCTDSAQFMDVYPECTNISVGYYKEHTTSECQDLQHLVRICRAAAAISWEALPVKRDPKKSYSSWNGYGCMGDWDSPWDRSDFVSGTKKEVRLFGDFSIGNYFFCVDPSDGIRKKAYVSDTWIYHETLLIKYGLEKKGTLVDNVHWDGMCCWVREKGKGIDEYVGTRTDLAAYLHMFGEVPPLHLIYEDDHRLLPDPALPL
jgi:hypothetical protein